MLALAHHFDELLTSGEGTYRARVYGQAQEDGMWGGWLVFFPLGHGRVISTERETTQSNLAELSYWASGLTHLYLHGALERALALQPEAQLARELEHLERVAESATARAETLESGASVARSEARLAKAARETAEQRLRGALGQPARDPAARPQARRARTRTHAADGAPHARKRRGSSKTKSSKT